MPSPATNEEFLDLVRKSEVVDERKLASYLESQGAAVPMQPAQLAGLLVRDGLLTSFQAEQFLQGKWRRFTIGRYKVLERLGQGGMGAVYLCEHKLMRRRVAVKVLPTAKADDPAVLQRFFREARAVAALDHPNIVRAYDIDVDDNLNFLVMEHVDGASLQEIVKRGGPLDPLRACHYIHQSALGLQHAHEKAGIVHRDIKPGNILVDRSGIVKILDMGLARFFHDDDDVLTRQFDEAVLGTADYLAPEQALDSHEVDIRADVYSLGGTFYYCLTGRTPFAEGTVAQKLIWHQTRQPKSIKALRQDVPDAILAILDKMMAKNASDRYQTPLEVAEALAPFTRTPIPPPPEAEMPKLSLAAMAPNLGQPTAGPATESPSTEPPGSGRRPWKVSGQSPVAPSTTPGASQATAVAVPAAPAVAPATPPVIGEPVTPGGNANVRRPVPPAAPAPRAAAVAMPPVPAVPARPVATRPAPSAERPPPLPPPLPRLVQPAVVVGVPVATPPSSNGTTGSNAIAPHIGQPARQSGPPSSRIRRQQDRISTRTIRNIVLSVAGALLVGGVAFFIWYWLQPDPAAPTSEPTPTRTNLYVRNDGANSYKTLRQALMDKGRVRDTIVLQTDINESLEGLDLSDRTIVGEGNIVWKAPEKEASTKVLLQVRKAKNFLLKSVTLDGAGHNDVLVKLEGYCPGTSFENVTLRRQQMVCVRFSNCSGSADRPIVFQKVRFETDNGKQPDKPQTAVQFQFDESMNNPWILDNVTCNGNVDLRGCIFNSLGRKVTRQANAHSYNKDTIKLPAGVVPEVEK